MTVLSKIIVPVDGSIPSLCAIIPALKIAKSHNVGVQVILISENKLTKCDILSHLNLSEKDLSMIIIEQKQGDFLAILLDAITSSSLVIISAYGSSYNLRTRVEGLSKDLLENTIAPIIIVSPELIIDDKLWRNLLIPLDGTPGCSQAMEHAIKLFVKTNLNIRILHITSSETGIESGKANYKAPYYQDYQQHEWPSWSREFVKRFCNLSRQMQRQFDMKLDYAKGEPADEILRVSKENDSEIIALAWHGMISESNALTLQKVLECSQTALLIVKIQNTFL